MVLLGTASLHGQQTNAVSEPNAGDGHLVIMVRRAERLSMKYSNGTENAPLRLLQPAVMRTGNKDGNPDGGLWLWLDGERPVATIGIWNRGPLWYCENSSLTDGAFQVSGWPKSTWRSPQVARKRIALSEAVPDSQVARQRAIRSLALKFSAREDRLGVKAELRLLPRPLYTYDDVDRETLCGAIFAFVYGTDPELLLQIEARRSGKDSQWQATFARLASAELTVDLDGKEVWSASAISKEKVIELNQGYCIVRESE